MYTYFAWQVIFVKIWFFLEFSVWGLQCLYMMIKYFNIYLFALITWTTKYLVLNFVIFIKALSIYLALMNKML